MNKIKTKIKIKIKIKKEKWNPTKGYKGPKRNEKKINIEKDNDRVLQKTII